MDHRKWDDIVQCPSTSHSDTHDQDVNLSAASLLIYANHAQVILQIFTEDQGKKTKLEKKIKRRKEDA